MRYGALQILDPSLFPKKITAKTQVGGLIDNYQKHSLDYRHRVRH